MDFDLMRSCFHPEATVDQHGSFVGDVDAFIEWARVGLAKFETTTHLVGNQLVVLDGDIAHAERYVNAFHRSPAGPDKPACDLICNIRYLDRLERRNGEWRVVDRVVVVDSERSVPAGDPWMGAVPEDRRGRRGNQTDLSYRR
jgi:hypothetical protein